MNGYLCQLKGTNDDRRVNSPCLAFEYECKLLFLRMGRSLADNSVFFYVIVLFDHFLCCLLLFDGSYHKSILLGACGLMQRFFCMEKGALSIQYTFPGRFASVGFACRCFAEDFRKSFFANLLTFVYFGI